MKGTIVSTGGGRIISAKGGADISIDTQAVGNDIHLGAINNNNRQGIVIIDDSSKGAQTFTSNSTYTPDNYAFGWTGGVNYRQTSKYNYTESGNIFEIFGRTIWGLVSSGFKGAEAERYVQEHLDKRMNSSNVSKSTYGTPTSLKNLTRGAFVQKINDGNTWNNIKNNNLYTTTSRSNVFNVKDYNYKDDWTIDTSWAFWETQIRMWRDWYSDEDYSATSTYYIPANKAINIETPTASQGGKISITANGNVYVDRNINNPTSGSSTEIKSVNGTVKTKNNSVIQSDNIKLEADKVITADVKGTNGNVNLNARSNYGNISIKTPDSLTTDGIRTYDGQSVTINAGGDINSTGNITALQVNLTSERGNISAYLNPRYTVEDVRLNSTAQGDITLTNRNGDLIITKVESKNGNVSLTAENGDILDGTGQTYELSGSTERLQRWIDAGLISSDDSDDSAEKSAAAQKSVVIEGLEQRAKILAANSSNPEERLQLYSSLARKFAASNEMKNARTFYAYAVKNDSTINQSDSHDVDAAQKIFNDLVNGTETYNGNADTHRADYLNRIKKFFADTDLTAEEMELVSNYAWANFGDAYGFSKNQLLYAIQDGILNSTPGQTVVVENPNIVGKNITLNATKGGIGHDDTSSQKINAVDLSKLENLKTLSTLKAGDLTWNANGDAIIKRQHPISLEIKNSDGANLSVSAKDQIYLVGTENSSFNFSKFEHGTDSNVRLMTGNGIFTNGDTMISAKDLIAHGGNGNVGTKENPFRVNLAGALDANSGDSVYISSVGENNLTIQAIAATNDVSLQSKKNIVMTTETARPKAT